MRLIVAVSFRRVRLQQHVLAFRRWYQKDVGRLMHIVAERNENMAGAGYRVMNIGRRARARFWKQERSGQTVKGRSQMMIRNGNGKILLERNQES